MRAATVSKVENSNVWTATESFSNGIDTALKYLSTAPPLQYDCGVGMF